ncbi:hypothetical protein PR048_032659 [Dryococelus australis]|uniref:Uncharacterized protein n=1 Tax=Dryococelus australis TaxID=614101 RepID=A0ABQ9G2U3_9NEOP|nr:hypothetical protein PR048_032659 [Dryococelus australis]
MKTGTAPGFKPTKWTLSDALSFLDTVHYEREFLSNISQKVERDDEKTYSHVNGASRRAGDDGNDTANHEEMQGTHCIRRDYWKLNHAVSHVVRSCDEHSLENLQKIHGGLSQFLLQPFRELTNRFWPRLTSPRPAIQFVPKMFYRVEVWSLGGPVQSSRRRKCCFFSRALRTGQPPWPRDFRRPTFIARLESRLSNHTIEVKHIHSEVTFAIGSHLIRSALHEPEPIADLQGHLAIPITARCRSTANEHTAEAPVYRGLMSLAYRLLASLQDEPGSIPGRFTPDFRKWESCRDDAADRRVFSGISSFPRPCIPALLHTQPHITRISSQDLDAKSRPNLFTHSLTPLLACTVRRLAKNKNQRRERRKEGEMLVVLFLGVLLHLLSSLMRVTSAWACKAAFTIEMHTHRAWNIPEFLGRFLCTRPMFGAYCYAFNCELSLRRPAPCDWLRKCAFCSARRSFEYLVYVVGGVWRNGRPGASYFSEGLLKK